MIPRILVVDDDENMLEIISRYGMEGECFFLKARTGKDALKIMEEQDFQVAVIDAVLPDVSGFDLALKIRWAKPLAQIIMLTALSSLEDKNRALKNHIREFISKPVQMEELSIRIQANLKIYHILEELNQSRKNYQNIVESLADPVFIAGRDLTLLYANPVFLKMYGKCGSLKDLGLLFPEEALLRIMDAAQNFFRVSETESWVDYKSDSLYIRVKFLKLLDRRDEILGIFEKNSREILEEKEFRHFFEKKKNHLSQSAYLQKSLMPQGFPVISRAGFHAGVVFSSEVGGDLLLFEEQQGRYFFVLSDVLGRGMGASYICALMRSIFLSGRSLLLQGSLPEFMLQANQHAVEMGIEYCVTAVAGILDPGARKLVFCSAGHNPPRIFDDAGHSENYFLKRWGPPLGLEEKTLEDYPESVLSLSAVEKIAFFTDGLIEFSHSRGKDIDYCFADMAFKQGTRRAFEAFQLQRKAMQADEDDASLLMINLKKPFCEEIHLSSSMNIDRITERFLDVLRQFDYAEKEVHAAFVVIQEMLSNLMKYCESGVFRIRADHRRVFLLCLSGGNGFNIQKTIDSVSVAMNHGLEFPEELLDQISLSGANLGLYMMIQNSDRFRASSDGRVMGALIRKSHDAMDFYFPEMV
jgi:serine phosphatase RsbU (regulator of sigma subunit)/FixJ family two-component response regulator